MSGYSDAPIPGEVFAAFCDALRHHFDPGSTGPDVAAVTALVSVVDSPAWALRFCARLVATTATRHSPQAHALAAAAQSLVTTSRPVVFSLATSMVAVAAGSASALTAAAVAALTDDDADVLDACWQAMCALTAAAAAACLLDPQEFLETFAVAGAR